MATKVEAAQVATATGTPTVVILGRDVHRILDFVDAAESVFVVSGRRSPSGRGQMRGVAETHDDVEPVPMSSSRAGSDNRRGGVAATASSQDSSDSDGGDDGDIFPWTQATRTTGTVFLPRVRAARARKRWVLAARADGTVLIEDNAVAAVRAGKSLFAAGVVDVDGSWDAGSVVLLAAASDGSTVARGVLTICSKELERVIGMQSEEVSEELGGKAGELPIAHRSTIVPFFL
jgi:glutamate 5-kinase